MPNVVINEVELYWELTGRVGEALVLVHGSWADHHAWDGIVPTLSQSFRVLTYDRRGHSQSGRPSTQGSVHEDVRDLGGLIEHLDLAPAHIVGSSFGGVIVLRLAAARPELFRTLSVHEPPLFGMFQGAAAGSVVQSARERILAVVDLLEGGQMEAAARRFMETVAFGPGAWAQFPADVRQAFVSNAPTFLDEERDPDSRLVDLPALATFSRPVLLTQGEISEPFFAAFVEVLARTLPTAERRMLAGAGHVPQVSHPEEYVQAIASFARHAELGEPEER